MAENITITHAVCLWNTFCATACFQDDQYDADLECQVRSALNLPITGQMPNLLKKNAISPENLLAALLNAMQPFSQMLNDLLQMFELASAQHSNVNLKIKFNFDADTQLFQFDLEHFRETAHSSTALIQQRYLCLIKNPFELIRAFDIFNSRHFCNWPHLSSEKAHEWLLKYEDDAWPDYMPEAPKTEIAHLDNTINRLWIMVSNAIHYYKQAYDSKKGRKESHREEYYSHRREDPVWQAELDYWVGSFIRVAFFTLEHINALPPQEKVAAAQKLETNLQQFINSDMTTTEEIEAAVDALEDILSLPFWKKRYELYAAWILAQITDSLKDTGVQFHAPDNMLSFSFQATRMATCTRLNPPLDIWAELRTEHSTLARKKRRGRANHIQPDYTLAVHDAKDPKNTVAVVECKQYKRASRKNFFEAITDYATGRPEAQVFLVNYGPISEKLLHELESASCRSFPFEAVRPGSKMTQSFCETLLNEVLEYYRRKSKNDHLFMYPWRDIGAQCRIQLEWRRVPKDLDLHLRITNGAGIPQTICYSVPGEEHSQPYAQLDHDCRSGYGCETIHIARWLDAEYDVIIDNYSGETEIDGAVDISISCGSDQYSYSCGKPWNRPFVWHALHLNSFGFQVIDHCIRETL